MNKPVLMIHEIDEKMFQLSLEDYTLTFDDALYSQYYYLDRLKEIQTQKIFFVSTGIVCNEKETQNLDFPSSVEAHRQFFEQNITNNYMKWSQIKEIASLEDCDIGGHSHLHKRYEDLGMKEQFENLRADTNQMIEEFKAQSIEIDSFCFPYNKEYTAHKELLKKYGITKFYGTERIAIEDLL